MRRLFTLGAAVALVLTGAFVSAAQSAAPEKLELPLITVFPDYENDVVVFVNTTREDYCTSEVAAAEEAFFAWLDGGMVGPPPPEAEQPEGLMSVSLQLVTVRSGATVLKGDARGVHFELWELDDPADQTGVGPCTDTDDAAAFFASGAGTYRVRDNDVDVSGTRGNAFGDRGSAVVTDESGQRYRYTVVFHVNDRCHAPETAPSACLVDKSSLKAL